MNKHSTPISELNAAVDEILRLWSIIAEVDLEVDLFTTSDDHDPAKEKIIEYQIRSTAHPNFGGIEISDEGTIEQRIDHELEECALIITTAVKVYLPTPLHDLFAKHRSGALFEAEFNYLGLTAELRFDHVDEYIVMSYFINAVHQLRLDAFTETLLRPNATALMTELLPYIPWFKYAAALADQTDDSALRAQLIMDMNLVLASLSKGGELNFAKLRSLCDVTGSLQPVFSLIVKNMPELLDN